MDKEQETVEGKRGKPLAGRPTFGAAEVVQALTPVTVAVLKPVARTLIKMGILAYEAGKNSWDELSREARAELAREREQAHPAAGPAPVEPIKPGARRTRRAQPGDER